MLTLCNISRSTCSPKISSNLYLLNSLFSLSNQPKKYSKPSQVGVLKVNTVSSSNANQSATTTITTVSSNNATNNNIITTSHPKIEMPATTTIQIHSSNHSISNSQPQQVCLESMQLSDVDVRTNHKAFYLIDVFCVFRCCDLFKLLILYLFFSNRNLQFAFFQLSFCFLLLL